MKKNDEFVEKLIELSENECERGSLELKKLMIKHDISHLLLFQILCRLEKKGIISIKRFENNRMISFKKI